MSSPLWSITIRPKTPHPCFSSRALGVRSLSSMPRPEDTRHCAGLCFQPKVPRGSLCEAPSSQWIKCCRDTLESLLLGWLAFFKKNTISRGSWCETLFDHWTHGQETLDIRRWDGWPGFFTSSPHCPLLKWVRQKTPPGFSNSVDKFVIEIQRLPSRGASGREGLRNGNYILP